MFRRYSSIGLIFLYLMFLLRVFVPYLEYQLRKETIVKELCVNRFQPETKCDGKCHLKKQIALLDVAPIDEPAHENDKPRKSGKKNFETEILELSKSFFFLDWFCFRPQEKLSIYNFTFINSFFHPPKLFQCWL